MRTSYRSALRYKKISFISDDILIVISDYDYNYYVSFIF